jgi:hypothetical protein
MVTVQRLYHTLPAQSTPSSAFIGHPPTTAVTAYISITKNENSYAIEIAIEFGDQDEWEPHVDNGRRLTFRTTRRFLGYGRVPGLLSGLWPAGQRAAWLDSHWEYLLGKVYN